MSKFPQPGEADKMAGHVPDVFTDTCVILTYGETRDVDGAPLTVWGEGNEIPCLWQPRPSTEVPGSETTIATAEWHVMVPPDTAVTRLDMVRLVSKMGEALPLPHVAAVMGDPEVDIGCLVLRLREVAL